MRHIQYLFALILLCHPHISQAGRKGKKKASQKSNLQSEICEELEGLTIQELLKVQEFMRSLRVADHETSNSESEQSSSSLADSEEADSPASSEEQSESEEENEDFDSEEEAGGPSTPVRRIKTFKTRNGGRRIRGGDSSITVSHGSLESFRRGGEDESAIYVLFLRNENTLEYNFPRLDFSNVNWNDEDSIADAILELAELWFGYEANESENPLYDEDAELREPVYVGRTNNENRPAQHTSDIYRKPDSRKGAAYHGREAQMKAIIVGVPDDEKDFIEGLVMLTLGTFKGLGTNSVQPSEASKEFFNRKIKKRLEKMHNDRKKQRSEYVLPTPYCKTKQAGKSRKENDGDDDDENSHPNKARKRTPAGSIKPRRGVQVAF